jgi:PAS domain S-box-containing protein
MQGGTRANRGVRQTVQRFGLMMALLLGLLLTSLGGVVWIMRSMDDLSFALRGLQVDNITWRSARLQVEHQALSAVLEEVTLGSLSSGSPPTDEDWARISEAFDIYYGRLDDFAVLSNQITGLIGYRHDAQLHLEALRDSRAEMAAIIDDPGARDAPDLARLSQIARDNAAEVNVAMNDSVHAVNQLYADQQAAGEELSDLARLGSFWAFAIFTVTLALYGLLSWRLWRTASRLDMASAQLATVLSASPEAVVACDLSGRLIAYNPAAATLSGYERDEFPGCDGLDRLAPRRLLRRLTDGKDAPNIGALMHAMAGQVFQTPIRHKSGRIVPIEVTVALHDVGDELIAIVFAVDISHRQRELRRSRRKQSEALQLAQMRERFLSEMSHEMRTPLHGVIASLDLLGEQAASSEQSSLIAMARKSAHVALDQVDYVLNAARRQQGVTDISQPGFNPAETTAQIIGELSVLAARQGNHISIEAAPRFNLPGKGNVRLYHRALNNLVNNACKFTWDGEIVVRLVDVGPDRMRVEVEDSGCGIDPANLTEIFKDYFTGDSHSWDGKGGSGLGLPIFVDAVRRMSGVYGVHSIPEEGSLFWFEIPFSEDRDAPHQASGTVAPVTTVLPAGKLRVLVIDDNEINCDLLCRMLVRLGHDPVSVLDGHSAVAMAATERFDLVMTDIRMDGLDGYQTAAAIRAGGASRDAVIIGVTAQPDQTAAETAAAEAVGMRELLIKPVTTSQIARATGRRSAPVQPALVTPIDFRPAVVDFDVVAMALEHQGKAKFDQLACAQLNQVGTYATMIASGALVGPDPKLADRIHYHISSCIALGLYALADELRAAERLARAPDKVSADRTVLAMRASVAATRAALWQLVKTTDPSPPA